MFTLPWQLFFLASSIGMFASRSLRFLRSQVILQQSCKLHTTKTRFLPKTWHFRSYCTDNTIDDTSTTATIDTRAAMVAIFTCNACKSRHSYQFGKLSYNKGVVIVRCPSCKNLHLVADNLGWFSDDKRNLETIAKEKGINMKVLKGSLGESLQSLGFTEQDAQLISKKRGSRIKLSDEVIQAIPEFDVENDEPNKKE